MCMCMFLIAKEEKVKSMHGGMDFTYFYYHFFPSLRFYRTCLLDAVHVRPLALLVFVSGRREQGIQAQCR